MKKLMFIFSALAIMSAMFTAPVSAVPTNKQLKQAKSDAAKKAKQLEKAGWIMESSMTLTKALEHHYSQLDIYGGKMKEHTSIAQGLHEISNGETVARTAAQEHFIQDSNAFAEGRIVKTSDIVNKMAINELHATFKEEMMNQINGNLTQSFVIMKPTPGDPSRMDVQVFYLYDPANMVESQMAALKVAAEKTGLSEEAQKILLETTGE